MYLRGTNPILTLDESLTRISYAWLIQRGWLWLAKRRQNLNHIEPSTFIGSGKVKEIIESVEELGAQAVIFDDELSPRHQRELAKKFGDDIKLLDRSALILDIFAQHASTREGSLQVELAQYEYRLTAPNSRQWTHLARQAGGMGGLAVLVCVVPVKPSLRSIDVKSGARLTSSKKK